MDVSSFCVCILVYKEIYHKVSINGDSKKYIVSTEILMYNVHSMIHKNATFISLYELKLLKYQSL